MDGSKTNVVGELGHRGDEPHLLREVFRTYQVLMSGFARKTGMPASRFALMRLLALAERDLGVTDLARHLGIDSAAVTRQVQELERERLVGRRVDSRDVQMIITGGYRRMVSSFWDTPPAVGVRPLPEAA